MGRQTVTMRKQLTVLLGMIGVFTVVSSLFIYEWLKPTFQYPEARAGVLDAREWSFAKQGIVPLRGEWEFYENKLLTPQDFLANGKALEAERRIVRVPGGWKSSGTSGSGYGAGTYRLRIAVSDPNFYSFRGKKDSLVQPRLHERSGPWRYRQSRSVGGPVRTEQPSVYRYDQSG
ncbi:hypothetical protein OMP38_17010 [Cohnella ginsengisoli]|uniref:Uncharacterized protein n=1 Tax=Cohnella ginsengisoli TaxID=425004 RepID=A0A9X4QP65_9BACL|nr:hypothetical protein [Cohnella ginsengisoli]MDG0792380.1 hypothetical protein [Cohnella ginsengisoli]